MVSNTVLYPSKFVKRIDLMLSVLIIERGNKVSEEIFLPKKRGKGR